MKLSKKELKTPDQIWLDMRRILDWMTNEIVAVSIVVGILLVGSIGIAFFYQNRIAKEGNAQFHYSQAKAFFEQLKLSPDTEAKKDSKIDRTKIEADLNAELAILDKDFSSSKAQQMSQWIRGQRAAEAGKWDEAIAAYQTYSKSLSGADKSLGLYPLAQALEQSGKNDKALDSYTEIVGLKNSPHQEWALLGRARVLKALNRKEDAKKAYEEFISKYPTSSEVSLARGLLSALGSN